MLLDIRLTGIVALHIENDRRHSSAIFKREKKVMDRGEGINGVVFRIKMGEDAQCNKRAYSGRESIPVLKGGEDIDRSKKRET